MKNTYLDLIKQSYAFPQNGFDLDNGYLSFQGLPLKDIIEKHGTPIKLMYLPKIGEQIAQAKSLFANAITKHGYKGDYHFCYCTKCNHFSHVINEALKNKTNLETSSSLDVDIIIDLFKNGKIEKDCIIVHNGYKTDEYLEKIALLKESYGFDNPIIVLDSKDEINRINKLNTKGKIKIGIRMAVNTDAQSSYHTSRLGIPPGQILDFYKSAILNNGKVELNMLHFFIDTGISDSPYYWGEFQKAIELYADLKKQSDSLQCINLGGGFPIRNSLRFSFDYEHIINEIISNLHALCSREGIAEPHLFTEFGKYTVGEAGAIIFEVLEQKKQNDSETWYIINNSLMNTIPDAWSIQEKFILLPINKWDKAYERVHIGGISCDHFDYYNSEDLDQEVLLPVTKNSDEEPLYLGFFHTGAYQDSVSGYGGLKHCLIPTPKHVVIDRDKNGQWTDYVFSEEHSKSEMLEILGYAQKS